jgi:GNAT superfamily N-acetyltransferase
MTMHGHSSTIRPATLDDVNEVARLYVAYRIFYGEPPAEDAALAFIRDRIRSNAGQYFLAWISDGQNQPPVAFMHLMPTTNTLAVRNQGIATSLLQHAEEFARGTGAERITLATAHDNVVAQSIYRKLGYVREDHFWYFHRVL